MGYRTHYNLSIMGMDEKEQLPIIAKYRASNDWAENAFEEDGSCAHETGWEPNESLIEFSKKYPELVFELRYDGDSTDDMGYIYFKNGKSQDCEAVITYESYDERKLV